MNNPPYYIDAHQHFWHYTANEYRWINSSMDILKQDFLPKTLEPILHQHSINGSIAVQARTTEQETDFLLELSAQSPSILGVIGWIDLCSKNITKTLEKRAYHKIIKGYRHLIQDENTPSEFLQRSDFNTGIDLLLKQGKIYEILVHEKDLPETVKFCQRHDRGQLILCHLGKPNIQHSTIQTWKEYLLPFADLQHVSCKISGLITEAKWHHWQPEQLIPYIHTALEIFGVNRLIFGSDWPVCLCSGSIDQVYSLVHQALAPLSIFEKNKIWGENSVHIYQLSIPT